MGEVQNFRKVYDWMCPVLIASGERSTVVTKCRKEPKTRTNRGSDTDLRTHTHSYRECRPSGHSTTV